jgi:predicted CxxxxCH...CXXCH cytochrome family protein
MRTKALAIIITGFIVSFALCFIAIAANDAPHNASNNMSCGSCHGETLFNSPFWGGSGSYDQLCLSCHTNTLGGPYSEISAPRVITHSSQTTSTKYGTWTKECRNCHNPHYQRQKVYKNTDASNLYLATGKIQSCEYNNDGTSTFTYSTIKYKTATGWDAAKLANKTGDYRGAILFPNVGKLGYNYPITAVGANTITVKGDLNTECTNGYFSSTTFAVIYGQYIKDIIDISEDGTGNNKTVKLFDQTGSNSFVDGDTTYDGICEVCHTKTDHYRNADYAGSAPDQHHMNVKIGGEDGQNCTTCHSHTGGFKANCYACHGYPPGLNGGPLVFIDKDGNPATSDSPGVGAHAKHYRAGFTCINCHTGGMLQGAAQGDDLINIGFTLNGANLGGAYDGKSGRTVFPYAAGGSTTVTANGSLECSNLYCHSDGTSVSTGVIPNNVSPPWNGSVSCTSCHGSPPSYPECYPKANAHIDIPQHLLFSCNYCHYSTTTTGYTITNPANHVNGVYDVAPDPTAKYNGVPVNFTYSFDDYCGGSCTNVTCHGNTLTWPWHSGCAVENNISPVGSGTGSVDKYVVTVTDHSYDPDWNAWHACGLGGPAQIEINWGDGSIDDYSANLTDTPANTSYTHTYYTSYIGTIYVTVEDNVHNGFSYGYSYAYYNLTVQVPSDITISGVITKKADGTPISGVNVYLKLDGAGPTKATTSTDETGNYSFNIIYNTQGYTVVPSKSGMTFTPSSIRVYDNTTTANFTSQ